MGPHIKDYSILGSKLGSPYFWILPYRAFPTTIIGEWYSVGQYSRCASVVLSVEY